MEKSLDLYIIFKDNEEIKYTGVIQKAVSASYNFTCRAKQDTYNVSSAMVLGLFHELINLLTGPDTSAIRDPKDTPSKLPGGGLCARRPFEGRLGEIIIVFFPSPFLSLPSIECIILHCVYQSMTVLPFFHNCASSRLMTGRFPSRDRYVTRSRSYSIGWRVQLLSCREWGLRDLFPLSIALV